MKFLCGPSLLTPIVFVSWSYYDMDIMDDQRIGTFGRFQAALAIPRLCGLVLLSSACLLP